MVALCAQLTPGRGHERRNLTWGGWATWIHGQLEDVQVPSQWQYGEFLLNFGLVSMVPVISPKLAWMFKNWTRYNSCTWHFSQRFSSLSELLMDWLHSRTCLESLGSETLLVGDWQTQKGKSMPLPSVRQQGEEMDKAWILIKVVRKVPRLYRKIVIKRKKFL